MFRFFEEFSKEIICRARETTNRSINKFAFYGKCIYGAAKLRGILSRLNFIGNLNILSFMTVNF